MLNNIYFRTQNKAGIELTTKTEDKYCIKQQLRYD